MELWATKEEQASSDFREKTAEIFKQVAPDNKYRLCVFVSGTSPLLPEVKSLIKYQLIHQV